MILAAAVFGYRYLGSTEVKVADVSDEVILYTDAKNNQFTVQYSASKETMSLSLSGVQYELKQTDSVSGDKYQSEDGKVVFSEKENEATVEINGEVVFSEATTSALRKRVEVLKSNNNNDPAANKYDFTAQGDVNEPCNGLDDDCSGPDSQVLDTGISVEQEVTQETMVESEVMESDQTKATDYNSTRSNRTTNN